MGVYLPIKDYSAMQGPAPDGFHVPLTTEWQGLKTIMDGFSLTTGANWRENLHMPFVGYRLQSNAVVGSQGSNGFYWSSSPYGDAYPKRARTIFLNSSKVNANDSYYTRSRGCSIRCFKNSFTVPTSSWTVITGTLGGAGIFRNQTEGLISITSDGTTGYTIQDKNLGATTVYNNGDTLTQANMGKMYQWGNNYGFPSTGSVTTSSTQVDASNYGPGNYYSSSTFITGSDDWSSVQNDNLWGATTGVKPMSELKNAYIGEYIPTSGLLGYRPLQSDLKDLSGNGNDGSWYIYSSGSGSFGTVGGKTGARVTKDSGDSSEHHIVTALNYSGPTVTMCGWIYYNSIQSSGRRPGVLTNASSGSNTITISPRPAQSNRWSITTPGDTITSTTTPSTGTWYFVVGVVTTSGKKIYVNGTQIASNSTGLSSGAGSIWRLGCGQRDADMIRYGGTDGYIRHCAVYNRELTASEILKYYNLTA